MKKQSVRVCGNSYIQVLENSEGNKRFTVEDLVKGAVIAELDEYSSAHKLYLEKSQEYIKSQLDEACTIKGMSIGDLVQSLQAMPQEATVNFSVSYDHSQNQLNVCQ
ncbi:hypothetical protein [Desulfurispira natronophila]|uniref:Uncharacterized protein n=1 Tax=Desulfurispira natronophila TaxID=682562 RepID=A0A7W8DGZ6_9BACT|nr:hypothetical protein [Desulfurispira natronophila]MBB5021975.1 hypothetical protein [Desulfurispira natronophila]